MVYDGKFSLVVWLGLNNFIFFPLKVLCKSHPVEFASYFHYCHSLTFDQRPDYGFLKRLFRDLFTREGISRQIIISSIFKFLHQSTSNLACSIPFWWLDVHFDCESDKHMPYVHNVAA